jgi:serine/threonine-protein kinase SRPK3
MNSLNSKATTKKNIQDSEESYSDSQDSLSSDDEFDVSRDVVYSLYNNRYIPIKYLGRGTFSRVWLTYDITENRLCGMKVIFKKYNGDAKDEIKRNQKIISKLDFSTDIRLSQMYDFFELKNGETALVYELLGVSMIDILNFYEDMIPINIVKKITKDVLNALKSLHSISLIHTDLKPENILTNIYKRGTLFYKDIFENKHNFRDIFDKLLEETLPENYSQLDKAKKKKVKRTIKQRCGKKLAEIIKRIVTLGVETESDKFYETHQRETNIEDINLDNLESDGDEGDKMYTFKDYQNELSITSEQLDKQIRTKLIDFGNSEYFDDKIQDEISVRCYRPPENYMNSYYNEKADIWSLGCLIFEFLTGDYLFDIDMVDDGTERDRLYLAEMFTILGKIPKKMCIDCEYYSDLFDKKGRIKKMIIPDTKYTSISAILVDEYNYQEELAIEIETILGKFLEYDVEKRISSVDALDIEWLNN